MWGSKWLRLCGGPNMTLCGDRLTWFSCGLLELTFFVCGSENIQYQCGHRDRLRFSVGIESDSDLVWGSNWTWVVCGRAKFDLVLVWESKSSWILSRGSRWTLFSWSGRQWFVLNVGVDLDLVSGWVVEIDFIYVFGSKLTWFKCRHRNWLGFCVGAKKTWY